MITKEQEYRDSERKKRGNQRGIRINIYYYMKGL
jgi:hypothetical protein